MVAIGLVAVRGAIMMGVGGSVGLDSGVDRAIALHGGHLTGDHGVGDHLGAASFAELQKSLLVSLQKKSFFY